MEVIDDNFVTPKKVKKILLCSGKIYFDLLEQQQKDQRKDVAIVRMEQLYPLPETQLRAIVAKYPKNVQFYWVQEEPRNMGAWAYIKRMMTELDVVPICRKASPSPAVGSPQQHAKQQQYLVNKAFDIIPE